MVGEHPCEISKLFEDRLFCQLDRAKHSTQAEAPKMVVVSWILYILYVLMMVIIRIDETPKMNEPESKKKSGSRMFICPVEYRNKPIYLYYRNLNFVIDFGIWNFEFIKYKCMSLWMYY